MAFAIVLLILAILTSCSPAKRITNGEYLYNKARIELKNKELDKYQLTKYQRITSNKRILGVRFHLWIYNLARPEGEKFPHKWFRRIGESPVVYDSLLVKQNCENFKKYISDKGYEDVEVFSDLKFKKKKVNISYVIKTGSPTLINKFDWRFEDTTISKHVYADTVSSLIKEGQPFDKTLMQAERLRIEKLLKNKGYYNFSREYIYYEVRASNRPKAVDVVMNIKQNISGDVDPLTKIRPHRQYKIESVNIYPNLQSKELWKTPDTVNIDNYSIIYYGPPPLKASTLIAANRIIPGELYSLQSSDRTYIKYSSLDLFRFINVGFKEINSNDEFGRLNCNIELAMRKRQRYTYEVVVTNSDNDFGIRGSVTYNNYNIFHGGEHLQLGFSGAIESLENRMDGAAPMREFGATARFETPKFLLPFSVPEFQRKYSPRTALQLSYNNQRQHYYVRTIANASFGYTWRGNTYITHGVYPIDFYLVRLPEDVDKGYYENYIKGTRLENSFINHTIMGIRYAFEYSNQGQEKKRTYSYVRSTIESAGLLINETNKLSSWGRDSLFFSVPYFQYLRGDIDFRHFWVLTPRDRIVYRVFAGLGCPYGNSESMPFEKMYWAGGPYGLRAWPERSLGPGSYPDTTSNQLGDIKIEANIEYRFKMFWKLEGALFVDAGNVWLLKDDDTKPGASIHLNTFLDDIAIGAGFGTRLDFSYFLIRFDFGFKLRDPSILPTHSLPYAGEKPYYMTGSKWTFKNPNANMWDVLFQFGIGYPF